MVIYQTELCNLKENKDQDKFFSDLFYNCCFVNGQKRKDPVINYNYFKNHGTPEQFEDAKNKLENFIKTEEKVSKEFEEELKNFPKDVKVARKYFYFSDDFSRHYYFSPSLFTIWYFIEAERK